MKANEVRRPALWVVSVQRHRLSRNGECNRKTLKTSPENSHPITDDVSKAAYTKASTDPVRYPLSSTIRKILSTAGYSVLAHVSAVDRLSERTLLYQELEERGHLLQSLLGSADLC